MPTYLLDYIPISFDWLFAFRPAALAMLHGGSPYDGYGYYNPPWMLLPFIPIALLPEALGRLFVFLIGLASFLYIAYKFNAHPLVCALFLLSYPVLGCLSTGGQDWFSMLGFVLPAPIGLIFALTKPQIGLGISLYWLVRSWDNGGIREVIRVFMPVAMLLVGSYLLYGPWYLEGVSLIDVKWNLSIFPYGIPMGVAILWIAIVWRRKELALPVGPLLSPYYSASALTTLLFPLFMTPRLFIISWICLWVFWIIQNYHVWYP